MYLTLNLDKCFVKKREDKRSAIKAECEQLKCKLSLFFNLVSLLLLKIYNNRNFFLKFWFLLTGLHLISKYLEIKGQNILKIYTTWIPWKYLKWKGNFRNSISKWCWYKDIAKMVRNKLVESNLIPYSVQQMHVLLLLPGNG